MHVQIRLRPDNIIGPGHLDLDGPLRANALLDVCGGPASIQQALMLSEACAGSTNRRVQFGFRAGLEQEWNHHHGQRAPFSPPNFHLGAPQRTDARVQDVFQPLARSGIGKNATGQFLTPQMAILTNDLGAKHSLDLSQSRLARLNHLPRQVVSIHYRNAARPEQLSGVGFAHANPAG